jgi:hypothetical protein
MEGELPFDVEFPFSVFEKADEEPGKRKRIGGIASIETRDRQEETVLQRGLDFSDFAKNGWFNDNHSKDTAGVVGYPDGSTEFFRKGQRLPSGEIAKASGHWVEGYLLDTPRANAIWELGKALQKTQRRLGLSVEGKILQRTGPQLKTIAKALVRNVAITNCPVNTSARMEILAKSLKAAEQCESDLAKTLGMGVPAIGAGGGVVPPASMGPQTGMGAGQVIARESLESKQHPPKKIGKKKKIKFRKSFSHIEAIHWLRAQLPHASAEQIERLLETTRRLKSAGKL